MFFHASFILGFTEDCSPENILPSSGIVSHLSIWFRLPKQCNSSIQISVKVNLTCPYMTKSLAQTFWAV